MLRVTVDNIRDWHKPRINGQDLDKLITTSIKGCQKKLRELSELKEQRTNEQQPGSSTQPK
jgi:hypothetical protein